MPGKLGVYAGAVLALLLALGAAAWLAWPGCPEEAEGVFPPPVAEGSVTHHYTFAPINGSTAASLCNRARSWSGLAERVTGALPDSWWLHDRAALWAGNLRVAAPGSEEPRLVPGRAPAHRAARLDRGTLEARPFDIDDQGFSVELWFRHHGMGTLPGPNDRSSGTLVALGDGSRNGWRLSMRFPERTLWFEIGRAQDGGPASLRALSPLSAEVWHHVVATWDRRDMRLYVNGTLSAVREYAGAFVPPESASKFRIGFVGNGLGSVRFDIDELSIRDRPLAGRAVLRSAYPHLDPARSVIDQLLRADRAFMAGDFEHASALYGKVAGSLATPTELVQLATFREGEALREMGAIDAAFDRFATMARDTTALPTGRRSAFDEAMGLRSRGAFSADRPETYEGLLRAMALSTPFEKEIRMDLARHYRQAGNDQAALRQYDTILSLDDLPAEAELDVLLERGRFQLQRGEGAAARRSLRTIADGTANPAPHRAIAHFHMGESLEAERRYADAWARYLEVAGSDAYPRHLRQEARERATEADRRARGLPGFDPLSTRTRIAESGPADIVFFVAPGGSDTAPGTRDRPFATIARARDAVQRVRSRPGMERARFDVVLRGGVYRLAETFRLTADDSGTQGSPVVYRAAEGETPRLSGAIPLERFEPVGDEVAALLPPPAAARVRQVDLTTLGIQSIPPLLPDGSLFHSRRPVVELFENRAPMTLARWPDEGWVRTGPVVDPTSGPGRGIRFEYRDDRPSRWRHTDDIWVHGYWRYRWADYSLRVEAIDASRGELETRDVPRYGVAQGMPYYYSNVLEELDRPGEWYLDRDAGMLYLYPSRDPESGSYELSRLKGPLIALENVSHLVLQGLHLERSQTNGLTVVGGSDVVLRGLTVRNVPRVGIVVDGGHRHTILDCHVYSVGANGISVSGGDRATLSPARHTVENCDIHGFGRLTPVQAAIDVRGVGSRLAHNLIYDSPGSAIRLAGNEHLVEFNEIHDVVQEVDDAGALDLWNDPSYRGNVIRYNYWHHIGNEHPIGQNGVRLDDGISGTVVFGNVFYRSAGGRFGAVNINGGRDNWIDNNVFVDVAHAIGIFQWTDEKWADYLSAEETIAKLTRTVNVDSPPHATRYPELEGLDQEPTVNNIWRNLVVRSGPLLSGDAGNQKVVDNLVTWQEPGFIHVDSAGVRVEAPSVDQRWTAFHRIPFEHIGLYPSRFAPVRPSASGQE